VDTTEHARRKKVREHPQELRRRVLTECELPGASVARIALRYGLNANLVYKWRRQQRQDAGASAAPGTVEQGFIALPIAAPAQQQVCTDIRIELRRGATAVNVSWPLQAAPDCAAWLGQWLR
jgi:transposase